MATTTVALTTSETEVTVPDRKSMRKRMKHFLKKHKGSGTPMKPESKLSKIQKSMMGKHHQHYESVPLLEEVRPAGLHLPTADTCSSFPADRRR